MFGKVGTMAGAMSAYGDAAVGRPARRDRRRSACASAEAYRQAEMAGRAVAVTEKVLAVAKAREAEIEARVQAGGALQADLLRARARRREREADVAERRSQQRMAQAGLARLLGAPGRRHLRADRGAARRRAARGRRGRVGRARAAPAAGARGGPPQAGRGGRVR